jgi:hypothetical protein
VAVSGLVIAGVARIVNVCTLDVPPPGLGFTTVIDAVPAVATREAGTVAVSWVEETKLVARGAPFQFTVEVETNLVPFTVKKKSALPAAVQVGLIDVVVGTGLLIVNVTELDVPPPGGGLTTVMDAVPAVATFAAGTIAVSLIEDTNVVVRAEPFQLTVEVETKLVPFTIKVNCALPAAIKVGLIEVMVGTRLLIVMVSVALPVPPALVALMVTLYVPAVVGVPEIKPVLVFTDRPAGSRPVTLKLVGLLVAVI